VVGRNRPRGTSGSEGPTDVRPLSGRAPAIDQPTAEYIEEVARRAKDLLGDDLVGAYLHGSGARGGFVQGHSDIDILLVVRRHLPRAMKEQLGRALTPPELPSPAGGLECHVLALSTVRRPSVAPRAELRVAVEDGTVLVRMPRSGIRDLLFHMGDAGEVGIAMLGPEPSRVFSPIPRRFLLEAMIEDTLWDAPAEYHVLNACRTWRYLEEGQLHSKLEGAEWARGRLGFDDLIDAAVERHAGRTDRPLDQGQVEALVGKVRAKLEAALGSPFRVGLGEVAGAIGDIGILVPLGGALILVNGLQASPVLLFTGLLVLLSGLVFRIPFPVQPLVALSALAVGERLSPGVIHAGGLEIGAALLLISVDGIAAALARIFTEPVIRSLQFGAGVLLVMTAVDLLIDPPAPFGGVDPSPWPVLLAVPAFVAASMAARRGYRSSALVLTVAGTAAGLLVAGTHLPSPSLRLPDLAVPSPSAFGTAFVMLVIPQLPLSVGNGVVETANLTRRRFGWLARRVTPRSVSLTSGLGNLAAGLGGGMPLGHGASGVDAHVRMGARTAGMNLVLGITLVALGLFFAPDVPGLLRIIPGWALAAFLAYAGVRYAMQVARLRGFPLALAVIAGGAGAALSNLAITAAVAIAAYHAGRRVRAGLRPRPGPGGPAGGTGPARRVGRPGHPSG
jgi:sulfate permease, SulP family